jgi:hypothetical protein
MQQTLHLSLYLIRENKMADIFTQKTEGGGGTTQPPLRKLLKYK